MPREYWDYAQNWPEGSWTATQARRALRSLRDEELQRGLASFDHAPDRTCGGCFVSEVLGSPVWRVEPRWKEIGESELQACSLLYEDTRANRVMPHLGPGMGNEWLKGEVLREVAERGTLAERPALVEVVADTREPDTREPDAAR